MLSKNNIVHKRFATSAALHFSPVAIDLSPTYTEIIRVRCYRWSSDHRSIQTPLALATGPLHTRIILNACRDHLNSCRVFEIASKMIHSKLYEWWTWSYFRLEQSIVSIKKILFASTYATCSWRRKFLLCPHQRAKRNWKCPECAS